MLQVIAGHRYLGHVYGERIRKEKTFKKNFNWMEVPILIQGQIKFTYKRSSLVRQGSFLFSHKLT
jgi:hypothetical protein